jgi:hypothetical protein
MQTVHLRILIERRTRDEAGTIPWEQVAETAVAVLLEGARGRIKGFNVEGYRWMDKGRVAPTVALSSLVEGWDRDLERDVKLTLAGLCRKLDQAAIAVALSPAESFTVTAEGEASAL